MKRSIITALWTTSCALSIIILAQSYSSAQTKSEPAWTLNDQNTILTGKLPSEAPATLTLDATEVEKMIQTLAQMRAAMTPPRPMVDPVAGTKINVATAGRLFVQADGTGMDLAVLHPGYGWVGLYMDQDAVEQLYRRLSSSIHRTPVRAKRSSQR
jgi:hypothetical protein